MKVLILAGGFAKRMGEIGKNTPKSLLPVAGRPVLEHILEKLEPLGVSDVFVSTNKKFEGHFQEWIGRSHSAVGLVVEPAMEEGKKLGSIGALDFFIKQKAVDEDLLVVFGDNLFEADMGRFMDFYAEKGSFVFGVHDTGSIEESRKMGVVLLDGDGRVTNFEEKPEQPKSTLVSTGVYVMPKKVVGMVSQYVREGNSADRFGDFLVWLMNRHNLHAFHFDKWFDIGTPETYARANEEFAKA